MKTSVRRQCLRQSLGANRNVSSIRWIGSVIGWITSKVVLRHQGLNREKADNGVEKSCLPRRRKRGLRRGKTRSRGGKPRQIVAKPTPDFKIPSARVGKHNERLFCIMRRAQTQLLVKANKSLRPRIEYGFKPGSFELSASIWTPGVERHLSKLWTGVVRGFPAAYRTTFFGASSTEFIRRVRLLDEERDAPPPLPPRRGRPPSPPARPVPWVVTNSTIKTHVKKDSYGPNPCAWCRAEWEADGEFGACLSIQDCVRNPDNIKSAELGVLQHRGKVARANRSAYRRR